MGGAVLMLMITDRGRSREFAGWYHAQGIPLVLTALGRGTATTEILDVLGLEATEKAVLMGLAPDSGRLVRRAAKELWLDVPGRGILVTVPVSSIAGAAARDALLHEEEVEKHMDGNQTHELVVVIANQGYTDRVMRAAREAGATGGTAIHAKGTGTELAKKFFGVSIAEEKEIVFIVTRAEDRRAVMKAVAAGAGMQTQARSLVFSLPVSDVAGLRAPETEDD